MQTTHPARYFVLAYCAGDLITVERDVNDMDLSTTITDLIEGQIEDPAKVFCAEDGRWTDVTEDVCQAIADRAAAQGLDLNQRLIEWISEHCGLRVGYALGLEAA